MQQYERIRRRAHIPESIRTPGKDDAADDIEQVIDEGRWPMTPSELADEGEWSRSHYRNVLDQYFEPVDRNVETDDAPGREHDDSSVTAEDFDVAANGVDRTLTIHIPADVTNAEDYIRGYVHGLRHQDQHQH